MKRIVVAALAALFPLLAGAGDIRPGTIKLSGSSGLSFSNQTSSADGFQDLETRRYNLGLDGSWFVSPTVGLGATFQLQDVRQSSGAQSESFRTTLVGPQVTLLLPLNPSAAAFLNAGVAIASQRSTNASADGWAWQLGAGFSYFPIDALSLDLRLGYSSIRLDDAGTTVTTSGVVGSGGISVYFGR